MMCACDKSVGQEFLAHQLGEGCELETQRRVPVTDGFQERICDECRGGPITPYPKAKTYGRTTKVQRYYWREIFFEEMQRFAAWERDNAAASDAEKSAARAAIEREISAHFRALHTASPKYQFTEESQIEVLKKFRVELVELKARYIATTTEKKVRVLDDSDVVSVEQFAIRYFERLGYNVITAESRPFHALFGIFMWLLIQDSADPQVGIRGFGDRNAFDSNEQGGMIWTHLPDDFGTPGYGVRRSTEIDKHLSPEIEDSLEWLFDYWLGPSEKFRQYLWAHKAEDVRRAREVLAVLPAAIIRKILRYLVDNYWGHYLGWPDLLVHNEREYFFAEIKSSNDKLNEDQKRWIKDNYETLRLPFKLVKIHKQVTPSRAG